MTDNPYLQWPVFRRSVVAAFQRSLTLQYLIFPLRVEINRSHSEGSRAERNHIVMYVLALIAAGAFLFLGPDALPGETLPFGATILLALINIHHFFIDGCVWKISTPEVKKDLFRHLVK